MKTEVKLKIADIVIEMQSDFPLEQLTRQEQRLQQCAWANECLEDRLDLPAIASFDPS